MHTKSLSRVQIKDADQGLVTAVISTFGVIDKDGDVTSKKSFTEGAPVVVSAYGHTSWDGSLPIGKGRIRTTDNEAIAELQFFLNTTHGRDAFETIKALDEDGDGLQEWSYSLQDVVATRGKLDGRSANFIESTVVKEVSPVLVGASVNTRTLAVKGVKQLTSQVARMLSEAGDLRWSSRDPYYSYAYIDDFDLDEGTAVFCVRSYTDDGSQRRHVQVDFTRTATAVTLGDAETEVEYTTVYLPKGSKFSEHADFALRGVKQLREMAEERVPARAAKNKPIDEQREYLDLLEVELAAYRKAIDDASSASADATQSDPDDLQAAIDAEFLRAIAPTAA